MRFMRVTANRRRGVNRKCPFECPRTHVASTLASPAVTRSSVARAFLMGFAVWYVLDSGVSLALGALCNAVSNTAYLLLVAVPLYRLARASGRAEDALRSRV